MYSEATKAACHAALGASDRCGSVASPMDSNVLLRSRDIAKNILNLKKNVPVAGLRRSVLFFLDLYGVIEINTKRGLC